jgi:hypothetical protein
MSEADFSTGRARRRGRKRAFMICMLMFLAIALGGVYVYMSMVADNSLSDAIAEADQLDPSWSILELESKRQAIPDAENSAVNLRNAKNLVPQQWPFWDNRTRYQGKEYTSAQLERLAQSLWNQDPQHQLTASQISALRKEMERGKPMVAEIHKIANKPYGRYPIAYTKDIISTLLPYTQDTRFVANVLSYDILLKAQDGDMEGAMKSARCLLQAQRAIGDEPTMISMLVRVAIRRIAVTKLERILAQGEPSEKSLLDLQRLLEESEKDPLLLIGARGERAMGDGFLLSIQNGDTPASQALAGLGSSPKGTAEMLDNIRFRFFPGSVKASRAALLRLNNQVVELAKLPPEEQRQQMKTSNIGVEAMPKLARLLVGRVTPAAWQKVAEASHRDSADMRCSIVMLAAERYRKANGRWPDRIDDLVPRYLAKAPIDPYDGKPLRLLRTNEGLTIYSVSDDGVDNGGKLNDRPSPGVVGSDRGLRLWDVSKRRQPPKAEETGDGN